MTQDERWEYGYRNKMEYSFAERNGQIVLAFFERGTKRFQSIEPCKLADPLINKTTEKILVWINKHKIPLRSLRAVIVRSNLQGKTIAALFIKDEMSFPDYPEFDESFGGFRLYFSNPRCPAAIPTKLLYSAGEDYLSCRLKKYSSVGAEHCSAPTEEFVDLEFGLLSFFQVHIPLFEYALKDMGDWIIPDKPLLDLYSGVGSIGLPLADRVSEVLYYPFKIRITSIDFTMHQSGCRQSRLCYKSFLIGAMVEKFLRSADSQAGWINTKR
jgi:23S rRNA (uracil1939-C5)-methyltransferase